MARVCYGYNTQSDGELVINEAEAKVVRWIFNCYLAGDNFGKIAAGLEKQGVLSPTGKAKRSGIVKQFPNCSQLENILVLFCCRRH